MPDGVVVSNDEGVPQGGPLSPLLSNIVLDELDWALEARGHSFVCYADDANIYLPARVKLVVASVMQPAAVSLTPPRKLQRWNRARD